jgi:hypothetical protein
MNTPFARNHEVKAVKTGKQLRQRFHSSEAWIGKAEIVRTFSHDGEEQTGVFPFVTPYCATREEAAQELILGLDREMSA